MISQMLLITALALPSALLLGCLLGGLRRLMPSFLWLAPVPALAAALFAAWDSPLVLNWAPYHVTLILDASSSMLLTAASLLWIAAGVYQRQPDGYEDNTHYSEYGAERVAALAVQEILRLRLPLADWLR